MFVYTQVYAVCKYISVSIASLDIGITTAPCDPIGLMDSVQGVVTDMFVISLAFISSQNYYKI